MLCSGTAVAEVGMGLGSPRIFCTEDTLGGQLKLNWVQVGCSGALHPESALGGQMKLKWVPDSVSGSSAPRVPWRVAGAEVG